MREEAEGEGERKRRWTWVIEGGRGDWKRGLAEYLLCCSLCCSNYFLFARNYMLPACCQCHPFTTLLALGLRSNLKLVDFFLSFLYENCYILYNYIKGFKNFGLIPISTTSWTCKLMQVIEFRIVTQTLMVECIGRRKLENGKINYGKYFQVRLSDKLAKACLVIAYIRTYSNRL